MAANTAVVGIPALTSGLDRPKIVTWSRAAWRFARQKPLGGIGAGIMLVLIFLAVFAGPTQFGPRIGFGPAMVTLPRSFGDKGSITFPWGVSPYDPLKVNPPDKLTPPNATYLLGTDQLGRDMTSRIIHGSRVSLEVGLLAVLISTLLGALIGMTSAYFGGVYDLLIQRVMDGIQAFPFLVLAMAIVAITGASTENIVLALAVVFTPSVARVIRGSALTIKQNQYIEAARSIGSGSFRIIFQHILPNVLAPVIILASVQLGSAILAEAALSFLGLGPPPPTPTWGGMLSGSGRKFMEAAPWLAIFPGIAISLAVMAFNLLGDALRDALDPRLRGST